MIIRIEHDLEIFDGPLYKVNKKLLKALGLWPTLSKLRKFISLILITSIGLSFMTPIAAGAIYYQSQKEYTKVLENFMGVLYLSITVTKYVTSHIFEDRIKLIYEQIAADWRSLTDEVEKKILTNHTTFARLLTFAYVYYGGIGTILFFLFPLLTITMDTFLPLENETRIRIKPYHPYYFGLVDVDKYYYELYLTHGSFASIIVTAAVVSIDTMFAANIQHACGLYAIVRHRLDRIGVVEKENKLKFKVFDDKQIIKSMKHVCDMHRNSIKSVDLIWKSFTYSFLYFLGCCLLGTSILIFDILLNLKHPLELVMATSLLLGTELLLFYMNWIIQQLGNSSEEVFVAAYSNEWYNLSVRGQKLLHFFMMNNVRSFTLCAGGIVNMNLQQFATILKTSVSYAAVMISIS